MRAVQLGRGTRAFVVAASCFVVGVSAYACSDSGMAAITPPPDTATSPAPGRTFDLRFKGVGVVADSLDVIHEGLFVGTRSSLNIFFDSAGGSPLQLGGSVVCGSDACGWFVDVFAPPPGVARVGVRYAGSILANLADALDTTLVTDTVITSLDIRATPGVFGISQAFSPTLGDYQLATRVVSLADLSAAAASEAARKRVITAVSFDAGGVRYLAYSWQHDTTSVGYDTRVVSASQAEVPSAAEDLGASGYVVTALGGNESDGFVLVGTRVHEATSARNVLVNPFAGEDLAGYAVVGDLVDDALNATVLFQQ